jgi:hypothetical protein
MGAETANVHLGTAEDHAALRRDFARRSRQANWLAHAARRMAAATLKDWKAWRAR